MASRLQGKVCVITGTGGSIGRAAAILFASEGAKVVGCDINETSGAATVEEVSARGGTMISLHPCDLTKTDSCDALIDLAISRFGRVDILYNNAAMAYFNWVGQMTDKEWTDTINEEIHLVFRLTKAAWPHLAESRGVIVNTASATAWKTFSNLGAIAHTTAKAGIVALTRHLAMEGRLHGIRANSISPGIIETNQSRVQLEDPEWRDEMLGKIMANRLGRPEEIANVALFLASDDSSYITGTDIMADGGLTAW